MSRYSVYVKRIMNKFRSPWREPEIKQIGEAIMATLACGPFFHRYNIWDVRGAKPRRRGSTN